MFTVGLGLYQLHCVYDGLPERLAEYVRHAADFGFWSWTQDGAQVFMAAEVEFAAFDTSGKKVWTRVVEPPWDFKLAADRITLNIMGSITHLDRRTGQPV